jgi:hypothetical protein
MGRTTDEERFRDSHARIGSTDSFEICPSKQAVFSETTRNRDEFFVWYGRPRIHFSHREISPAGGDLGLLKASTAIAEVAAKASQGAKIIGVALPDRIDPATEIGALARRRSRSCS